MASIISIVPIVLLFVLMLGFKMAGHKSALLTLVVTVLLALFAASPLGMIASEHAGDSILALTGWAVVEGLLKAVFPILIIILMAIYSYNILVESKQIEVIKKQFTSITDDKGLLVLLLVWGFGGLLEGMAGFGTAVAIPAAILIGLGFKPMFSALVSLVGNTVATGFGAVGVPVTTLCNEVADSGSASVAQICETSAFAIIQLSPLFIILPFIILTLTDRHNLVKNLVISLWVGMISVAVQFVCGYYLGSETPAIIGSIAAIVAIIVYAKVFARKSKVQKQETFTFSESFKAWSVYLFILVFILVSGALCPPVNAFLKTHLVSAVGIIGVMVVADLRRDSRMAVVLIPVCEVVRLCRSCGIHLLHLGKRFAHAPKSHLHAVNLPAWLYHLYIPFTTHFSILFMSRYYGVRNPIQQGILD